MAARVSEGRLGRQAEGEANHPYEGIFKGLGKDSEGRGQPALRVHPEHNKSSVEFGTEPSADRFAFSESKRNPALTGDSCSTAQPAGVPRHVDRNRSSLIIGDDGPLPPPITTHAQLAQARTASPKESHPRATHNHNSSTLVLGDTPDKQRFSYAEERRGHAVDGKQAREELLFAAAAQEYANRVQCRNRRNESAVVFGADCKKEQSAQGATKEFGTMPGVSDRAEVPGAQYKRDPRSTSLYGNFDQSE